MAERGVGLGLPEGVSDQLPERARALAEASQALGRLFELHGYERVDTPAFELAQVLERGLEARARAALFRMVDPTSGEVVVLRPDFTAQLARLVSARLAERPRPLRLHYQGRVLRAADPDGRGLKSRELYQAGVELVGLGGSDGDLEILELAARALALLPATRPPTLDLGHAALLPALLPPHCPLDQVEAALAHKDPAALAEAAPPLLPLLELYGAPVVLDEARRRFPHAAPAFHAALDELAAVCRHLELHRPDLRISVDLAERRGLGYYTGLFFAGFLPGAADPVLLGGRYDALYARYARGEPAVGLALDLDAIVGAPRPRPPRHGVVLVTESPSPALRGEAERRRAAGERAVFAAPAAALAYARINGYRAMVFQDGIGGLREEVLADEPAADLC